MSLPNLTQIGSIKTNSDISIETDIIDVTNFDQNTARFVLPSKGFLHPNSKLTFSVDTTGLDATNAFYPLNTGIASLLSSVRLSAGGQSIQTISDFANFTGYRSCFIDNEINKDKEAFTQGRSICHSFEYLNGSGIPAGATKPILPSDNEANGVQLNNNKDNLFNDVTKVNTNSLYKYQLINNKAIFQLNLSEVFPMLKLNQLPLYLVSSVAPIVIDLTFTSNVNTGRACIVKGGTAGQTYNIKQDDVKIIADFIYFPQNVMDEYANANPSLQFTYFDYQLSKTSLTSVTAKNLIRNVGGGGRIVTKVVTSLSKAGDEESLLNSYSAEAPERDYSLNDNSFNGKLTANVKYNNHFLFPIDVSESAVLFHHTQQTEGVPPFILREEYNREGAALVVSDFEGLNQSQELGGKFFYQSFRLNRDERVGSRGIELYYKYDTLDPAVAEYVQRCYLEVAKVATLENGKFDVQFA
tara:strand:- start:1022 stop:2428 length:1407 start_codon:yes stop_codon:yes gene_type:complete